MYFHWLNFNAWTQNVKIVLNQICTGWYYSNWVHILLNLAGGSTTREKLTTRPAILFTISTYPLFGPCHENFPELKWTVLNWRPRIWPSGSEMSKLRIPTVQIILLVCTLYSKTQYCRSQVNDLHNIENVEQLAKIRICYLFGINNSKIVIWH